MPATTNDTTTVDNASKVVNTDTHGTTTDVAHGAITTTVAKDTAAATLSISTQDRTASAITDASTGAELTEFCEDMIAHWTAVKAAIAALAWTPSA